MNICSKNSLWGLPYFQMLVPCIRTTRTAWKCIESDWAGSGQPWFSFFFFSPFFLRVCVYVCVNTKLWLLVKLSHSFRSVQPSRVECWAWSVTLKRYELSWALCRLLSAILFQQSSPFQTAAAIGALNTKHSLSLFLILIRCRSSCENTKYLSISKLFVLCGFFFWFCFVFPLFW